MKRLIKSNTALRSLPTSYLADAIRDLWNNCHEGECPNNQKEYDEYFHSIGIEYTEEQWENAWELACGDDHGVEEEVLIIDGEEFHDKSDALRWLNKQHKEYGNTHFFPQGTQIALNKLIEKFGNTYFWNR